MQLNTKVCDLLNIQYPILQGGMAWIAGGRLAGAVSEAGGLGIIGSGNTPASWLKEEIKVARESTSKNFGVNLMLTSPYLEENLQLTIEEKIPVVTTGGGNPGLYMKTFKEAGIKVIPVVASVALARRLERLGADALIVEGAESGGHIGEMSTMCLVPMVADEVKIPIIAAGGIFDARGLVAALALGAQGVQIGTRFICTPEAKVHQAYQNKVIKAKDRSTVICGQGTGHPVRAIQNNFSREFIKAEKDGIGKEELQTLGKGRYPLAAVDGDVEQGSILAGQISALVKEIQPSSEVVKEIIQESKELLTKLGEF
ncbi:Enoyl-[acyl-carrier-protein] reductase [FMN, NADH] [Candidatus Syntrophocurvum alkaliphilum]|uniref:Probable nitronate monooxygenase n=1 Tax=Candidatus Syntrophocurvum alkaliphilum TaxID=2293317 RepID=A0A6I6DB96_9FIRM|nr:enoyl-[acyl-carrier-protein] reductase FabK [Candidatus Syntrophocurvum alkaliphilum]QGT98715.1 Enoyl-[acyl-carrier-protein] reductase [FMN, NADH] [Candidatus Syntrophocurvum alkaliphilum]